MRFWDYFPHPFEHPGWFIATLTIVGGLIAGLCGNIDMMCAIGASGAGLMWFKAIANFFYHGVDKPGWKGLLFRSWLKASVIWTCVYWVLYLEYPAYEDLFFTMLIPWGITLWIIWAFDH